jgi:hypothetical protein
MDLDDCKADGVEAARCVPDLTVPLACVGMAAGYVAALAVARLFHGEAHLRDGAAVPAICGGIGAAVSGLAVGEGARLAVAAPARARSGPLAILVVVSVLLTALVAAMPRGMQHLGAMASLWTALATATLMGMQHLGAVASLGSVWTALATATWMGMEHLGAVAALGMVWAMVCVPAALVLANGAMKAARARPGSVVGWSGRRELWGGLATALALATVPTLPYWGRRYLDVDLPWIPKEPAPEIAVALALGGSAAALVCFVADVVAVRRMGAWLVGGADVDLGIGDAVRTQSSASYRRAPAIVSRLVGDAWLAREALLGAAWRSGLRVAAALCVLGLHGLGWWSRG